MSDGAAQLEALKQRARAGDTAALAQLRAGGFFGAKKAVRDGGWPLSAAQRRLWIIDQMRPGLPVYNMADALQLDGALDVDALRAALRLLVARHETLRTTITMFDGEPRQTIGATDNFSLREIDESDADDATAAARDAAVREALTPFDLARGPLFRATLVRLTPERHLLLCTLHHIVSDAWSTGVLRRELAALYAAGARGAGDLLPPLRAHYRDFASWQNRELAGPAGAKQRDYWLAQLGGERTALALPTDFPRPAVQTAAGRTHAFALGAEVSAALTRLGATQGATPFMTLLALMKVLLARHTGQDDIVVGSPVAGRERVEWEGLIGFFVNTLALRDRIDRRAGFADVIAQVRATCLGAYEHELYPFDRLVDDLRVERDLSRPPLFDVAVQLAETDESDAIELPGLRISVFDHGQTPAKCDLSFDFSRGTGGFACVLTYNCDLFTLARIERLGGHLRGLADSVVTDPRRPVGRLAMLPEAERARVLTGFNPSQATNDGGRSITAVFEEIVARQPGWPALRMNGTEWSYAELDRRANRLAHVLRGRGVGAESVVAVLLERDFAPWLAFLGIVKAGGVYLALDPLHPAARLADMVHDSGSALILSERSLSARAPGGAPVVELENLERELTGAPDGPPSPAPRPEQAAYLIYTSGSTGAPKGVVVEHRGLVNTMVDQRARLEMMPADRVLQFAKGSFDASIFEAFLALLSGATLVPARREALADPREFLRALHAEAVTVAVLPPSFVRSLGPVELPLRILFTAGEAAWPPDVEHHRRRLTCVNGYGPTEVSICSSAHIVRANEPLANGVPIGSPLANTQTYLLDAELQPVPIGVLGDIWVGGMGVARGYWRRPELTAERFMPDPFAHEPGARLYRTGDLGRWREDGVIEFHGRADTQVKLRGYRIELGEIEATLVKQPGVREAAVVLREDRVGVLLLVAYIVPVRAPGPTADELRAALRTKLPDYMVPAVFIELAALPVNQAGKVNRRALPAPETLATTAAPVAPRSDVESALAAVWRDVLRLEHLGVHDDFFRLGGNSLLAIQAISRLRDLLKIEVSVLEFFEHPTVAGLAATLTADESRRVVVEKVGRALARLAAMSPDEKQQLLTRTAAAAAAGPPMPDAPANIVTELELLDLLLAEEGAATPERIAPRAAGTPAELSFAQRRLWFLQQLDPASPAYNITVAIRLTGRLDVARLEAALNAMVRRHETLRASFPAEEGRVVMQIAPELAFRVRVEDVSVVPAAERDAELPRRLEAEAARPFDLAVAPLLRLTLLRAAADEHVAVLVMHHLVSDAWSMDVFIRELGAHYAGSAAPAPLAVQYGDFAAWQRAQWRDGAVEPQLAYWRRQLADPPTLALPIDRPRPARPTFAGATLTFALPPEIAAGVRAVAQAERATVFMVLLAAFQALLHRYSGQDDLLVGTPVAGRMRSEVDPLIGFFVNTLVLRVDCSARPDFSTLVRQARRTTLEALAHQDVPFERLVQELQPERHLSHNPLFQVMVSAQPAAREALRLEGLALTPMPARTTTAKFDLLLNLEETADGIVGALEYSTALFDAGTMERFIGHFTNLLSGAISSPATPVTDIELLSPADTAQILRAGSTPARPYPVRALGELFAAQAAARPVEVAVKFVTATLTYGELDARANRLAHVLVAAGVQPDTPVPVCLERSLELIVALLGVVKAGGAYVALDPEQPVARLALLLAEARGPVLLTQKKFAEKLGAIHGNTALFCLDGDESRLAAQPATAPTVSVGPEHLAYISYTSGSTGHPKGVCVPHRAVARLVLGTDFADLGPAETFLQLAPIAFDASTLEIWAPLLNGGRLVIAPPGPPTLEELGRLLRAEKITTLWLTAGLFHLMVDERLSDLGGLRQLLAGGDVLSVPHARAILAVHPHLRLVNGYGPTENTTFTCCHLITAADFALASIPIGRPIAHTQVYVLDAHQRLAPIGVPGELCAGGAGLARSYFANPELTAEKFIANPFGPGRLYRTGDRVRWRSDGTLEFLGRLDTQIKLRGYRIEPGEVEAALLAEPGVKSAAVAVHESAGRKRLVGYVTGAVDGKMLRAHLQTRLPDYLVPAAIAVLDALPLKANGKVDRAALPPANFAAIAEGDDYEAPRDEREREVAAVWSAVLGLTRVGIHDSYFVLGGDSISAIQVTSRLKRAGWRVDVRDLFQYPTVADLAAHLQRGNGASVGRATLAGPVGLTPAQTWFFARHAEERHHFNQAVLLRVRERLDAATVAEVVRQVWGHHDALRTVFAERYGAVMASILEPAAAAIFESIDLTGAADAETQRLAHTERVQRGFDLTNGPLFKTVHFRLPDGDRLLLVAHHLVVDGVSWRILLEDFEVGLRQRARGDAVDFGPKTDSIKRWADVAAARANGDELAIEADWWGRQSTGAASSESAGRFGEARTISLQLDAQATRALLSEAPRAYHAEINDLLLAALVGALPPALGGSVVRLVLEGHGRDDLDAGLALDRTVGWFTSLFPVALPRTDGHMGAQIKHVKEALRAVPRKGVGFGLLAFLRAPARQPVAARVMWPRISFNYLGQFGEESGGLLTFADEATGASIGSRVARQHEIDFGALVARGRMELTMTFNPALLSPADAERMLADWRCQLETVSDHCIARPAPEKTPADFTSRVFTLAEYEEFLRQRGWDAATVDDVARLAPMHAGLLFQSEFDAGSPAYFVQMAYGIRGRLQPELFAQAWRELARRHSALRTSFVHERLTVPVQVVWRECAPEVTFVDLRELPAAEQERRVAEHRRTDLARGFELEGGALLRVALFQMGAERFEVVWSYHHVLLDGWSLGLVHRDLVRVYAALAAGRRTALPPVAPYRDYLRWLEARAPGAARDFWTRYLAGYEQTASVPRVLRAPADGAYEYAETLVDLGAELSQRLREVAARAGATVATLVQAVWGVALARYNRTDDVVFGGIVSGRPAGLPGVEEMVGLFICAVPVRVRPRAGQAFTGLLRELQTAALAAEEHHHLPTAEIQALTPLGNALFDHVVIVENYPVDRELARAGSEGETGWTIEHVAAHDRTHYDFDLTMIPGDTLVFKLEHNRLAHPVEQVASIAGHLRTVCAHVARAPETVVGELELLPETEVTRVLLEFNATNTPLPAGCTLLDLLEDQAARTPERVAAVFGSASLTYRELHGRANRVACHLRRLGVGPEVPVGLCVERGLDMLVGVLGIWKAGGAYVPLDPLYPAERLAFVLEDARVPVLLTQTVLRSVLPQTKARVAELDGIGADIEREPASALPGELRPDNLAYLIYTSGSTGRPKGVMVEHRSLVNAAIAWRRGYGEDVLHGAILQMASLSFDVFAGDFIRALTNGGSLIVCDAEVRASPAGLCELLTRHRVALFESTPGLVLPLMNYARTHAVDLSALRLLIVGSDTLPAEDHRRLVADFGATRRIVNSYGVTEATIDSSFFEDRDPTVIPGAATPIGRPLANTRLYVLDERHRAVPAGVAGELFIGGAGVARGYLNRPELDAALFITLEIAGQRQRLYRTGDLVRWLPDGNLEFLGRGDGQVKVRGFRVETGEIESRLRQHPAVREVAVVARSVNGANELVAYVVSGGRWEPAALRAHVVAALPDPMAPAYWVRLDQLPLSPNGKVDRRALPAPDADGSVRSAPYVAPRTPAETALAVIWCEVLQVERVGVEDNFFELGGHSLKAMQVVSRVQQQFGVKPGLRAFFQQPTVAALAASLGAARRDELAAIPPAPPREHYELSHAQQRLWLLHRLGGESAYNMPEAYVLESEVDADALERAFQMLVARHETLRTAFVEIDGEPRQRVLPMAEFRLRRIDLQGDAAGEARARELADREAAAPFDLRRPPLLRGTLITLGPRRSVFLFTMHHIIGDGWSGNVLYREVFALYAAARRGGPDPLRPLRIHYKDFAAWQKARGFSADEAYWLNQLAGVPGTLALPYDVAPGDERDFRGHHELAEIDAPTAAALRRLARARRTTVANVVLAVFDLLLFQLTKQEDLCIGVSIANRNHPDLENLIGFFVNILPVRVRLDDAMEFDELLREVVAAAEEAFEHQDYPFDLLIQKLNPARAANRQPVLNVIYAFQNFADVHIDVGATASTDAATAAELAPARVFEHEFKTSKFDLTLFVTDDGGKLALTLEYDTGLFRAATIRRHLASLTRFAGLVAAQVSAEAAAS